MNGISHCKMEQIRDNVLWKLALSLADAALVLSLPAARWTPNKIAVERFNCFEFSGELLEFLAGLLLLFLGFVALLAQLDHLHRQLAKFELPDRRIRVKVPDRGHVLWVLWGVVLRCFEDDWSSVN